MRHSRPRGTGPRDNGYSPTTGSELGKIVDGPNLPLPEIVGKAEMSWSYSTFVMFVPNGENSTYVPLSKIEWAWNGSVRKVAKSWEFEKDKNGIDMKWTKPKKGSAVVGIPEYKHPVWEKSWRSITPSIGVYGPTPEGT